MNHISDVGTTWQTCHAFDKDSAQYQWYEKLLDGPLPPSVVTLYNERNASVRAQVGGSWGRMLHRGTIAIYLILVEGSGTWSLEGKEFPAKRDDILYTEPWVYHGLTNTSSEQLIFVVVRFNSKGVAVPPRPDDRPDEQ